MNKAGLAFTTSQLWSRKWSHPRHPWPRDHLPLKPQQTSKQVSLAWTRPRAHCLKRAQWPHLAEPITVERRQNYLDQIRQIRAEPQCLGDFNPHHQSRKKKEKNQAMAGPPVREKCGEGFQKDGSVHYSNSSSSERARSSSPTLCPQTWAFWIRQYSKMFIFSKTHR